MPIRRIDDIKEGDVFIVDLVNAQGAVLVAAGTPFRSAHLRLLRTWGIEAVRVRSPSDDPAAEEAALDAAEQEIKRRFGPVVDNEIMAQILQIAIEQRASRLAVES